MSVRKEFTVNENGQWIDEDGLWHIMDFFTGRYDKNKPEFPLPSELDLDIKSVDGKGNFGHKRTPILFKEAEDIGIVTKEQREIAIDYFMKTIKFSAEKNHFTKPPVIE